MRRLFREAFEMHLDAADARVPYRAMLKGREVEVGTKVTIEPGESVQVECRGDALAVVLGGVQHALVFAAVDAKEQRTVLSDHPAHSPQERSRLRRMKVADRGAREERDTTRPPR